jgi:hypothetical protein
MTKQNIILKVFLLFITVRIKPVFDAKTSKTGFYTEGSYLLKKRNL